MLVKRLECPHCGAECFERESVCWKCGGALKVTEDDDGLIDFSRVAPPNPETAPPSQPATVRRTTLTGEVVEVPDFSAVRPPEEPKEAAAPVQAEVSTAAPVFRMTYCKTCGIQNDEGAERCRKCNQPLPVVEGPPPDLTPLRRSWGFDLLGLAWVALGLSAVYCGWFIVKADSRHPGITWADYFWTGIVACAPGILVFLRHYLCRVLFWIMTFGSLLVWAVIGFLWLYIGLHVTENGRIGLMWLAALSTLSAVSYVTVRLNDEFDFGS